MKKRILACLLALVMLIGVLPVMALAEDAPTGRKVYYVDAENGRDNGDGTQEHPYQTVGKALTDIDGKHEDGATVHLAEGVYYTYTFGSDLTKGKKYCSGLNVTFIGEGPETVWYIGTPTVAQKGETNGDYSFDGAESVTFQNMTLRASAFKDEDEAVFGFDYDRNYTGFIRINHTIVKDCVIKGRTAYWGYISATFTNTTFICPHEGYAVWTYSSPTMTFDHCVFNSSGKVINVPSSGDGPKNLVVNYQDCIVNSSASIKSVFNVHDYGDWGNNQYPRTINISGHNEVYGLYPNRDTCSRLFQVEVLADNEKFAEKIEKGYGVTINFGSTTVWKNGAMVDDKTYHNSGVTANGVAYTNDVDGSNDSLYAEGYKDNVINVTPESDWAQQPDGSYKRTVKRVCKYCGYEETVEETKRDEVDDITAVLLPALQANTDDHYSYLIGYSDGTVRPNGKITRAEVATIFFRLLDDDTRAKYWSSENNFSDVSADKWYNNAVSTLSNMGVIGGYADGTFRPDAPISRAEFAKIAVSFTQNTGSATYNYFTDVKTTDWFAPYVTAAKDAGLIEGYSDGSFKPESKITRAEACAIVNRTLGRKPSKAHMKISDRIDWPDVQTTDWFYEAIMEATNSHTCTMGDRVETWTGKLPQRDWATLETGWANAYTGR